MKWSFWPVAAIALSSMAMASDRTTPGNRYLPANETPWAGEAGAPVELGALWGDRAKGEAGTLLRTPPGFRSGPHSHTADYWAVVVQGSWEDWVPSTGEGRGIRVDEGAHWNQVKTQHHEDACVSDVHCVIFLFNKAPYVTEYPAEKAK